MTGPDAGFLRGKKRESRKASCSVGYKVAALYVRVSGFELYTSYSKESPALMPRRGAREESKKADGEERESSRKEKKDAVRKLPRKADEEF